MGHLIRDEVDSLTQIPIVSLHGKNRKPRPEHLAEIDLLLFDLQDVGARFYTYLSTLHLVMEACGENNITNDSFGSPKPQWALCRRPCDGGCFYKGYLGKHNIPIVHGLTLGEFAKMINGEGWLVNGSSV